jgi:hypothetical protein
MVKATDPDGIASVKGSYITGIAPSNMKLVAANTYRLDTLFLMHQVDDVVYIILATDTAGHTRTASLKLRTTTRSDGQVCGTPGGFSITPAQ